MALGMAVRARIVRDTTLRSSTRHLICLGVARAGCQFETLIAELEGLLARTPVTVTSPDRIRGAHSGELREVDASVRGRFGSIDLLVILECRERRRRADVTWIEQLASNADDVGAHQAIAVSRSGFSPAARRVAEERHMTLRGFEPVEPSEIFAWLEGLTMYVHRYLAHIEFARLLVAEDGASSAPAISGAVLRALREGDVNTPILRRRGTRTKASLADAWHTVDVTRVFSDIAIGSPPVRRSIEHRFATGTDVFQVDTELGRVDVAGIRFECQLGYQVFKVPFSGLYRYVEGEATLTEGAEFMVDDEGTPVAVQVHRDPETGEYLIATQDDAVLWAVSFKFAERD